MSWCERSSTSERKSRDYDHRLMDYNNDTTTHLADVRSLFAEAISRASGGTPKPQGNTKPPGAGATRTRASGAGNAPVSTAEWNRQAIQIVKRASEMLDTPEKWNHVDDTKCRRDCADIQPLLRVELGVRRRGGRVSRRRRRDVE